MQPHGELWIELLDTPHWLGSDSPRKLYYQCLVSLNISTSMQDIANTTM